jgi:hypothetical protein
MLQRNDRSCRPCRPSTEQGRRLRSARVAESGLAAVKRLIFAQNALPPACATTLDDGCHPTADRQSGCGVFRVIDVEGGERPVKLRRRTCSETAKTVSHVARGKVSVCGSRGAENRPISLRNPSVGSTEGQDQSSRPTIWLRRGLESLVVI